MGDHSQGEMMIVAAARMLRDNERAFIGIGQPNLAANLAKRLYAPGLVMIYEAGVIGADPLRLPLSIGDPCLVSGALSVCSMYEVFSLYLQRGLIDVGFLGAAQVDRFGNLNSTVIGDYHNPKVRLAGSGGACDIAILSRRTLILIPHSPRRFPERVDFITSPGYLGHRSQREALGISGGPEAVITNLGVMKFDETGEMYLAALHSGVSVTEVKENTGWDLKVSRNLEENAPPTPEELRVLREELDPHRIYLGKLE
ncbi:MAG: CoA-transferase [Bacillota bacterium]|jgi:glutaconate CoA-transferase subunit B